MTADKFIPLLLMLMMLIASALSASVPPFSDANLTPRLLIPNCHGSVVKAGTGSPRPSCKYRQVTGNLDCDKDSCSTSNAQSRTFGWSASGSASADFATLGFDVSESYTSGNTRTCSGTKGHKVCVIAKVAYIEYTAKVKYDGLGCTTAESKEYTIRAPDKKNRDNYVCGADAQCVALDHEVWEHNGKGCT